MKEYVERESAVRAVCAGCTPALCSTDCDAVASVKSIPAADVAEVRHGQWQQVEVMDYPKLNLMLASMWCPVCKRYHNEVYYYGNPTEMAHYCGLCGAKMDGGADDAAD